MIFNIPQFIDKEDKIVGPLTAKQLGWLFLGGATLLILWNILDSAAFYISAIPIAGASLAFAFYRPYNQSLNSFIFYTFLFISRNKIYIWRRLPEKTMPIKKATSKKNNQQESGNPKTNSKRIEEISKLLDNKNPMQ